MINRLPFRCLVVCLLLGSVATAQIPGYQGLRLAVHIDIPFFPGFVGPFHNDLLGLNQKLFEDEIPSIGVNVTPEFSADYVVSREIAVGIDYKTHATACNMPASNIYYDFSNGGATRIVSHFNVYIRTHWYGIYLKRFKFDNDGAIAPVGQYDQFEIAVGKTTPVSGTMMGNNDPSLLARGYNNLLLSPITNVSLGYVRGFQTVILKRLLLNAGLGITVIPAGLPYMSAVDGSLQTQLEENTDQMNFFHSASGRLAASMMFSFRLGLGFLAF